MNVSIGGLMNRLKQILVLVIMLFFVLSISCARDHLPKSKLVPAAPSDLLGDAISDSEIQLSWHDNSDNETGFEIYRGGPVFNKIATLAVDDVFYTDSLLQDSTTYSYFVKAVNLDGASNSSNTVEVTTFAIGSPPDIPRNPIPYIGDEITVLDTLLQWQSEDPDGDTIRYDLNFDCVNPPRRIISNTLDSEYRVSDLIPDTTYYWYVIAKDNHKHVVQGPVWNFLTRPPLKKGHR
jgi:hypothetical protein